MFPYFFYQNLHKKGATPKDPRVDTAKATDFGIGFEAKMDAEVAPLVAFNSGEAQLARPKDQGATVDIVCCSTEGQALRSSCRAPRATVCPAEVPPSRASVAVRGQRAVQIVSNPVYDEPARTPESMPHSYRPSISAKGPVPVPVGRRVQVGAEEEEDSEETCSETYMTNAKSRQSLPAPGSVGEQCGCTVQSMAPKRNVQYDPVEASRRKTVAAEALGVTKTAGRKTVTQAFRKHVLKHHPDKGGNTVDFQAINAAYSNLTTATDDRE